MENQVFVLFFRLLSLFLLFSAASAAILLLRRRFRCRIPSAVWGVLFLLSVLPLAIPFVSAPAELTITTDYAGNQILNIVPSSPAETPDPVPVITAEENGSLTFHPAERAETEAMPSENGGLFVPASLWQVLFWLLAFGLFLWTVLALARLTSTLCGYITNIHYLTSRSAVCHDERICAVFEESVKKVRLLRRPVLRVVEEGIHLSPCTSGFFTPTVYISHVQSRMMADELEYIFLHELCHVRRHDFLTKLLALTTTSIHFFAPFAGEILRQVYEDCEFGCDRMVISHVGENRTTRYMQTILSIAAHRLQQNAVRGELFSYASAGKEMMLRRYRNLLEKQTKPPRSFGVCLAALLLGTGLLHTAMFSAVNTEPVENPQILFQNPFLESVLREYYGLTPEEMLTMEHLDGIYCLEFSRSDKAAGTVIPKDTLALACTVNEGKYLVDFSLMDAEAELWTAVVQQKGGLADGVAADSLQFREFRTPTDDRPPEKVDSTYDCTVDLLPDACPLATLERYMPEEADKAEILLSYYTCLDGTEEALNGYASEIYKTVIREKNLSVNAGEDEITAAFVMYCRENGIPFDAENPDTLGQLKEHLRSGIAAVSPAALFTPMVLLDPGITEGEMDALVQMLYEDGLLADRLLPDAFPDATGRWAIDLADLVLFRNLRTVILNDRLTMADTTELTNSWCAVIER